MVIKKTIDYWDKIKILGEGAQYDVCLSSCFDQGRKRDPRSPLYRWIYPASLPNGTTVPILKVLMTNSCQKNCLYCVNPIIKDRRPVSFSPEELSNLFIQLLRGRFVHGLFLSSGVDYDANKTMEKMIKAVEIIREKFNFPGYIHLKILPGTNYDYIEKAVELANRVSLNLEAPSKERLKKIAPVKNFETELIQRMKWIYSLIRKSSQRKTQTTQFVVGAANETDSEILQTTDWLYKNINLWRAYFSAFQPVRGTPLENHPPALLLREHRLYQADYSLRFYGFSLKEIVFNSQGNLPIELDPKMAWALNSPDRFPVEVNIASYNELIRVPGIGPKSADKIIKERKKHKFFTLEELKNIGIIVKRAAPFLLINGKRHKLPLQLNFNFSSFPIQ